MHDALVEQRKIKEKKRLLRYEHLKVSGVAFTFDISKLTEVQPGLSEAQSRQPRFNFNLD